jgi:2-polyprenyl-3-methyl-5-hydroxy-6-metoxy-1,4-benzoquinol methylase
VITSRKVILEILDKEAASIVSRYKELHGEQDTGRLNHLVWYLGISRQWAVHHLKHIDSREKGDLLDIGAYFGLIAGASESMGWRVSAIDASSIPDFSSTRISGRNITISDECYNGCVDSLPYPDNRFDVIVLSEVLEHLPYSPLKMFREFRRVLKPGGVVQISTPNPAGIGKLVALAMGRAPLEPDIKIFAKEDDTYTHKGLTFFKSWREAKLWTVGEIRYCLEACGMEVSKHFHYGNTVGMPEYGIIKNGVIAMKRILLPCMGKLPFNGGSIFLAARKPD